MRPLIASMTVVFSTLAATSGFAESTFQQTCSNISFAYAGGDATIQAVCLRANGSPNQTSLKLSGIGNDNGRLVQGSGPSTFQQSCGNIGVTLTPTSATLTAFCRTASGASQAASLPLDNISNNNGNLSQ